MRATCVVIRYPILEEALQVIFRQRHHKVQAFSPERAQKPLTESIRLGTPDWDVENLQSEVAYTLVKLLGENRIAVMDEKAVVVMNRDGFAKLMDRP